MKILLENWNSFLNEQEEEQATLDQIKDTPDEAVDLIKKASTASPQELKALLLVYFVGLFLNGLVIYQFFKELIFLVAVDLVKLKDELVFGGMGDFFKFLFSSIVVFSML